MTNKRKQLGIRIILGLVFLISNITIFSAIAQITNQSISFKTPKVSLTFNPPLQHGINAKHGMDKELPRLNLVVNLLENYIIYLNKLQKIATGTSLQLSYAPEHSIDTSKYDSELITLKDLGLNAILKKVNSYLKNDSFTKSSFLLDNLDSLFTIPDNFNREAAQVVEDLKLENLSISLSSLEPEADFCIVSSSTLIVTRPYKQKNRLVMLHSKSLNKTGKVLLKQGKKYYSDLKISSDKTFVAFTEGNSPSTLNIKTGKVDEIFAKDKNALLLHMAWSPKKQILAGMILYKATQERAIFIFDALTGKRLSFIEKNTKIKPNYQFAPVFWSPDGSKFIITSGKILHLIDVENKKVHPSITRLPNNISELIWGPNNKSFSVVEIVGQARDKYIFDDLDFRKSILHSFHLSEDEKSAMEDQAQRTESRNTIKLISYWTLNRILYVEGRLVSKKLSTPIWDLSRSFSAQLTPSPSLAIPRKAGNEMPKTKALKLPMKYLYVFKNLNGKYKNVYDAGYSHTNHLYLKGIRSDWFIGLRKPEGVQQCSSNTNLRSSPYPFDESNTVCFQDIPGHKIYQFLKFLQEYDLRSYKIARTNDRIWLLANFSGPMNLWTGNMIDMIAELNGDNDEEEDDEDEYDEDEDEDDEE